MRRDARRDYALQPMTEQVARLAPSNAELLVLCAGNPFDDTNVHDHTWPSGWPRGHRCSTSTLSCRWCDLRANGAADRRC
jgi:hypothetical protein